MQVSIVKKRVMSNVNVFVFTNIEKVESYINCQRFRLLKKKVKKKPCELYGKL